MKTRHRVFSNVLRILLVLLTLVMIVITTLFILNLVDPKTEDPIGVDDPKDQQQTFTFTLEEYTLFNIDELDFAFILADLSITSNYPINLSLSHFETSERIKLNSVDTYLSSFERAGYYFKNQNVVFSLTSPNTEMQAQVFIPVLDLSQNELLLNINLNPKRSLRFSLNDARVGTVNDLGINQETLEPEMIAQIDVLFKSTVSPTEFYQLDQNGNRIEANFTSQSQIVGVKLNIENKSSVPFRLTRAVIKSSSANFYDAVDESYRIEGINNLSEEYITESAEGYLFFEILGLDLDLNDFTEIDIYLSSTSEDKFYTLRLSE